MCSDLFMNALARDSGVSSSKIWGDGKIFGFRRIKLFCLEKRLSMHTMTIFSKHLGGV